MARATAQTRKTPGKKNTAKSTPNDSPVKATRSSTRDKAAAPTYTEPDSNAEVDGEEEDEQSDIEVEAPSKRKVKPAPKKVETSKKAVGPSPRKRKQPIKEEENEDVEEATPKEAKNAKSPSKAANPSPGRKRKQVKKDESDEEDEDIEEEAPKGAKNTKSPKKATGSSPAKKRKHPKKEEEDDDTEEEAPKGTKNAKSANSTGPSPAKKRKQARKEDEDDSDVDEKPSKAATTWKSAKSAKVNGTKADKGKPDAKPPPKKRKTKAEKEAENMPLVARTTSHALRIGAHVSAAGGVPNSVTNSLHIGGNAFALFLQSQRKWNNPALSDEHVNGFHAACKEHGYDAGKEVLPHGSYLVNLAAAEKTKADQAYNSFLDDLKRCDRLGIKLYNFHPGNTNGLPRDQAIQRISSQLNKAHKATADPGTVVTVLENMAGAPTSNTLGATFEDLRDMIANVDNRERVGVCLDTCHMFAAGYDLRTPDALSETLSKFDEVIGEQYLRAVHLNDSKGVFKSHRDLHQNIGLGFIGLRGFHAIMNEPRFKGLPMVLETPIDKKDAKGKKIEDKGIYAREIKLLESLVDMDVEGDEFKKLECELAEKGAEERKTMQEQFDKKNAGGKGKGKKAETSDEEDEDDDE